MRLKESVARYIYFLADCELIPVETAENIRRKYKNISSKYIIENNCLVDTNLWVQLNCYKEQGYNFVPVMTDEFNTEYKSINQLETEVFNFQTPEMNDFILSLY